MLYILHTVIPIAYAAKDPPRFSLQARYLIDATLTPLEVLRHFLDNGYQWMSR